MSVVSTTPPPCPSPWLGPRCVYNDTNALEPWLDVNTLVQDVELQLGGEDLYATHTAVRHLAEIQLNSHSVNVMISPALRKHPAFSPWLCNGRELYNRTPGAPMVCTLKFGVQARHVQDNADKYGRHHASFDVRVGGGSVRALLQQVR